MFNDDFAVLEKLENLNSFQQEYSESFLVRDDAENIKREFEAQKEIEEAAITYKAHNFIQKEDNTEFSDTLSFENICPEFIAFALSKGLILEPANVRLIFSALASTRLLFLRSLRSDLLPKFVEVLNEYLENHHVIVNIDENIETERDLIWTLNADRQYEKTEFVKSLYQAKAFKNHINVITLNNVDIDNLDYFESFYYYCNNFNDAHFVDLGTDEEEEIFEIPNNVYFIMIPSDYNYLDKMPKALADCSFSIELNIRENELESEVVEKQNVISFNGLEDLMKIEKDLFFLPEETWKSFDEIEEQLSLVGHFRLGNKPTLQIERFATALLGCGADLLEVIDSILACKFVPITKSFKNLKDKKNLNTVYDVILSVFDEDTIPTALKLLKKVGIEEEEEQTEAVEENTEQPVEEVVEQQVVETETEEVVEQQVEETETEEVVEQQVEETATEEVVEQPVEETATEEVVEQPVEEVNETIDANDIAMATSLVVEGNEESEVVVEETTEEKKETNE